MKRIIAILILGIGMMSCNTPEEKMLDWIESNKKPIKVNRLKNTWSSELSYTLISADGKIYHCGEFTTLILPAVIEDAPFHPIESEDDVENL